MTDSKTVKAPATTTEAQAGGVTGTNGVAPAGVAEDRIQKANEDLVKANAAASAAVEADKVEKLQEKVLDQQKAAAQVTIANAEDALTVAQRATVRAEELLANVRGLEGKKVRAKNRFFVDPGTNETFTPEGNEVKIPTHWLYDQIQAGKAEVVEDDNA